VRIGVCTEFLRTTPVFGRVFFPANAISGAERCAFAMFSGQNFETLKKLIRASDFVPKLTVSETGLCPDLCVEELV
jgi:hypothetical protein